MIEDRWRRKAYSILEEHLGSNVVRARSLAKETTLGVGGPAELFVVADTFDQLKRTLSTAIEYDIPWFILGKGSNLLVSDAGFQGIVLRLGRDFRLVEVEDGRIKAGCGAMLSILVRTALKASLGGLAFAVGIPGTLGGALAGNAGAHGGSIGALVENVTVYTPGEKLRRLQVSEISFAYRHSSLGDGEIVLEASLKLHHQDSRRIKHDMERFFRQRKEKQPLRYPNAGSTFKNPPGNFAARLIDEAGCRGLTVGGAQIADQHANFIINTGEASARDVYDLIAEVQRRVCEATGIVLEPEIKTIGSFSTELSYCPENGS